jgi:hypothetical protein
LTIIRYHNDNPARVRPIPLITHAAQYWLVTSEQSPPFSPLNPTIPSHLYDL